MAKKKLHFITIIICSIFLTGCWNYKELTDIGIVTAVGIDTGDKENYKLTFQIFNPKNFFGGQTQGGLNGPPVVVYSSSGNNILEASRSTSERISRQLYLQHADLLVISEEVAKNGIRDFLDIFVRSNTFRTTATIVIAKNGKAGDLLQVLTPLDQIPAAKIEKTLKFSQKIYGKNINEKITNVVGDLIKPGNNPIISGFSMAGNKKAAGKTENTESVKPQTVIFADAIGLFKDDKLTAWAENEYARGINFVLNNIDSTVINLDWNDKRDAIGLVVIHSKAKVKTNMKNNHPKINIHLDLEAIFGEITTYVNLSDYKNILKVQKALAETVEKEIQKAIQLAQKNKTDVFKFGEKLSKTNAKYWDEVKDIWDDEIFPNLEVNVKANAFIRRAQTKESPFLYDNKGGD